MPATHGRAGLRPVGCRPLHQGPRSLPTQSGAYTVSRRRRPRHCRSPPTDQFRWRRGCHPGRSPPSPPRPHRLRRRARGQRRGAPQVPPAARQQSRPHARIRAASTGGTRWRGRGPATAGGRVGRAPIPAGSHAVGGGGRSQRHRCRAWSDGALPRTAVGTLAGRVPPRQSCVTAPAAATRRAAAAATPLPPRGSPRSPYGSGGCASDGGSCAWRQTDDAHAPPSRGPQPPPPPPPPLPPPRPPVAPACGRASHAWSSTAHRRVGGGRGGNAFSGGGRRPHPPNTDVPRVVRGARLGGREKNGHTQVGGTTCGGSATLHCTFLQFSPCTAVLSKTSHANCCTTLTNRPLRPREGRFVRVVQPLACEVFERTAVSTVGGKGDHSNFKFCAVSCCELL